MDSDLELHSQSQRLLQLGNRIFATVRVAAVVSLGDAGDPFANAPPIGDRGGVSQEHQVPPRHERIGQPRCSIGAGPDRHVGVGQGISAECRERIDRQNRIRHTRKVGNAGRRFQLDAVTLPVVERHGLDMVRTITVNGPV